MTFKPSTQCISYILSTILLILSIASCNNQPAPQQSPLPSVTVSSPLTADLKTWDEFIGRFRAIDRVEVRSRVSGYLESINFEDGQLVEKGDVLFVIDQRPFKVAVEQAEANLLAAQNQLEQARMDFNRVKGLEGSGAISQEQFDRRRQEFLTSQANAAAAKASLNAAKLDLTFTEVKAPVAGKISENFVSEGNFIDGGTAGATLLTRIVSLDPIYFTFEASESQLLNYLREAKKDKKAGVSDQSFDLKSHQPIHVKLLDENNFSHTGEFNFVDNVVDRSTGTLMGRATFENKDYFLMPGMFGRARLSINGKREYMLVPDKVIGSDQTKKFVLVATDSNTVRRKFVETGALHNSMRVITNGINQQDRVIINGIAKVQPGQKVQPSEGKITLDTKMSNETEGQ